MDDEAKPKNGRERGSGRQRKQRRDGPPPPPRPLDSEKLKALALHYAARYATTSSKLADYLRRKLRVRPWEGDAAPDVEGLVARLVALGYVNDAGWAAMKRREMQARGLGPRRVSQALHAAGVLEAEAAQEERPDAEPESAISVAVRFARRRRLGPFRRADAPADDAAARKAMAAMLRAGHSFDVARRVLAARDEAALEALDDD
jgi:regulatory protein